MVDFEKVADSMETYIASNPAMKDVAGSSYKQVKQVVANIRKLGMKDMNYAENAKQLFNSQINNR